MVGNNNKNKKIFGLNLFGKSNNHNNILYENTDGNQNNTLHSQSTLERQGGDTNHTTSVTVRTDSAENYDATYEMNYKKIKGGGNNEKALETHLGHNNKNNNKNKNENKNDNDDDDDLVNLQSKMSVTSDNSLSGVIGGGVGGSGGGMGGGVKVMKPMTLTKTISLSVPDAGSVGMLPIDHMPDNINDAIAKKKMNQKNKMMKSSRPAIAGDTHGYKNNNNTHKNRHPSQQHGAKHSQTRQKGGKSGQNMPS